MGSSNLRKKAMLEIYPEWEETGDMAAGSFSEGAWIHFLPWLAIGGVSTLLGWWKIPIISCCNCNLSTVSPGKWGSAYDLPFTMGLLFFRKRAAQFDPGAEKFPGTRRESQLSGSTHLGWLLLWQLCLSTRGRKGISNHPHRCRPNEQVWQFSVTCETVAVKVEVRSITKVVFFCCFFWVLLVNLSVSDWITFNWINCLCQPFFDFQLRWQKNNTHHFLPQLHLKTPPLLNWSAPDRWGGRCLSSSLGNF